MSAGINISNYESFLLRFIDGDLTAAELASLQDFLDQHPHVQEELKLWESTVLTPDPQITFDHKELLYRGQLELDANNQTSFLLSYLDNELSASEKDAVEKYIATQPAAKEELALLQMTRLVPDLQQVFVPKSTLYRHRRNIRPAIWWSIGAAAVVTGLLVWVLPMQQRAGSNGTSLVAAAQHTGTTNATAPDQTIAPSNTGTPAVTNGNETGGNVAASNTQGIDPTNAAARNITPPNTAINNNTTRTATPNAKQGNATIAANTVANNAGDHAATPGTTGSNAGNTNNSNSNLIAANTTPGSNSNTTLSRTNTANNTAGPETISTVTAPVVAVSNQDATADKAPVMLAAATTKEQVAAPASIHGELIASVVSTGDSKLLDKVTNVARFFAKKKSNNK